jgi:hypothetical protein
LRGWGPETNSDPTHNLPAGDGTVLDTLSLAAVNWLPANSISSGTLSFDYYALRNNTQREFLGHGARNPIRARSRRAGPSGKLSKCKSVSKKGFTPRACQSLFEEKIIN